ncbi:receptor-like protein kinase 1 [Prunus dulcis]|uniref:Receptor-like serine/threonine-protein kinase n=1 Tax=Prunus dulcis TaxID=3755 RepID=A0A4Y1RKG0_PRUDU|nr:receptor-like protein kinase 1 [Prunus dulcis]
MLLGTMAFELAYAFCFLLMQLPFSTIAQTDGKNISLGSSLTALDNKSFWASPSGEFAFGFQEIGKYGFLLAIWFNKVPERTIVWSANGDNLVQKGSTVELTSAGQFRLSDITTGKQIWVASSYGTGVVYAAMLDTGNFVLANRNSIHLWASFDQPTDTILHTQTLSQNSRLFARYTASNYSRGRFQLTLESDGNLRLYTTLFPLDSINSPYWSTNIKDSGVELMFNQSGSIYLTASNGSILTMVSDEIVSMQDFYQRATLDYDGVFRHYVCPKSTGSSVRSWNMAWSTLSSKPKDICMSIFQDKGVGACGFNSICTQDQGPICQCPYGYTDMDPADVWKGCKPNFAPQSCGEASSPEAHLFYFAEMQNTNWPVTEYNYFQPATEDWCRQACLADCFCAVANYRDGQCWLKGSPLFNGRIEPGSGIKALIKVRNESSTLIAGDRDSKKKDNSTLILVGSLLLSSSGFLNILLLLITYLLVSRMYCGRAKVIQPYLVMNLKYFTYEELEEATNGFKEELGRGAFATVFKGVLRSSDNGKYVAVKRLDNMVKDNELEFKAEISSIGKTNHKNLVQLLGFCNEGQHRILVYEFMSNGSLAGFLFGESMPNWYKRRQIALGIARGLLYLHEDCSSQIIHCDIKPQNILLDDSIGARISDFGLAKLLKMDQTHTTTGIRGTKGYVAPEWFKNFPITLKVDVYSYGILLLEIVCCRRNFEQQAEDEDQMILADWAYDCYEQKKLHLLFKNDDEAMEDMKTMEKYVMIAIWCIQEDPSLRPTTKKLTLMLEGTVEVSIPPNPSSFTSSIM